MSESGIAACDTVRPRIRRGWLTRVATSRRVQRWAAAFPLTRGAVRREGEKIFDLVSAFTHSQILLAIVELGLPGLLERAPETTARLAQRCDVPEARMAVLIRAAAALGLLRLRRDGTVAMTRRLATLCSVPGLREMILHHKLFYRDLAEPAAFFRGETAPELARFWPYASDAAQSADPQAVARYSALMAATQPLVIDDTLAVADLSRARLLMDVGGGTGSFVAEACRRNPRLQGLVFDLPPVVAGIAPRWAQSDVAGRLRGVEGSFRDGPLPRGADTISLVRVLFDHGDATVAALLAAVFAALPPGGRLIVSEPMAGSGRSERAGDAYFALYTMAMGTGCARSAETIRGFCAGAGFRDIRIQRSLRPFVTRVVTARKT